MRAISPDRDRAGPGLPTTYARPQGIKIDIINEIPPQYSFFSHIYVFNQDQSPDTLPPMLHARVSLDSVQQSPLADQSWQPSSAKRICSVMLLSIFLHLMRRSR